MRPPKKAQAKPAKGSPPKSQNTTGRIVNKTQPQTDKQAPTNAGANTYVNEFHDYLKEVKTPEQVKAQWGEALKAKSAAEVAGDRRAVEAAKDVLEGLKEKANAMRMSVNDLPTVPQKGSVVIRQAGAMAAKEEPLGRVTSAFSSNFVAKQEAKELAEKQAQAAAARSTPRNSSPAPAPAPKSTPPTSAAPKAAKGSQGGYSKARVKQKPHKDCGKKVLYKDTKSVRGTGLQKDHTPSSKAIFTAAMEKMKPLIEAGDLSRKQAESIAVQATKNAPTIAIPADVHRSGNTYGGKNKKIHGDQRLYERDAKDLNGAAKRDTQKISETMADKKHGCSDAYNKAAAEITGMDWNKYVADSIKQGMKGI